MPPRYVSDKDKAEYRKFAVHHLQQHVRALPNELWHYTSADALEGILRTGKLFTTQVTCLNDNLEQRYLGDLLHETVKKRLQSSLSDPLRQLYLTANDMLSDRDFSNVGAFVSCFSEVEDDLGQWRGYGGGECGYAVGFKSEGILAALKNRPGALLLPMHYDVDRHNFLVEDVLKNGEIFYLAGLQKGNEDVQGWAKEFLDAFGDELDIFASMTKHPKFAGELERRIVTTLGTGEHSFLEFRQKRTLLARHLPIDLTIEANDQKKLPISRIYVGPGPAKRVSQVSVGDMLLKYGYNNVRVEVSVVPYRNP